MLPLRPGIYKLKVVSQYECNQNPKWFTIQISLNLKSLPVGLIDKKSTLEEDWARDWASLRTTYSPKACPSLANSNQATVERQDYLCE